MTTPQAKLAILISGNGSNLQAIINKIEQGVLNAQIVCVISNKAHVYGLERAEKHGLKTYAIVQKDHPDKVAFERTLLKTLAKHNPDLIILAGFMRILSAGFVESFTNRIVNIHPSLLPKYKGLNTHARALTSGDAQHGASVHVVTPELDSGKIILQRKINIENTDTVDSLQNKVQAIEHEMFPQAIKHYLTQIMHNA